MRSNRYIPGDIIRLKPSAPDFERIGSRPLTVTAVISDQDYLYCSDLLVNIHSCEFVTSVPAERHNTGKPQLSLLPSKALAAEAKVWEFGATKYGKDNWKRLWGDETPQIVLDSALRHLTAIMDGQDIDDESGGYHAAHVRCNMAMLIEYYETIAKKG